MHEEKSKEAKGASQSEMLIQGFSILYKELSEQFYRSGEKIEKSIEPSGMSSNSSVAFSIDSSAQLSAGSLPRYGM